VVHGQRSYNGVAILARSEPVDVRIGFDDGATDDQSRLIAATIGGVRILSAYFPNGQLVGSEKWSYKLAWIRRLRAHMVAYYDPAEPLALCGDFNIAREDRDVAQPAQWGGSVHCHPEARRVGA
jgi:exodeoxyribonuclease-3